MTSERPLSPHLQIYRLPLAALLSISHRISGVLLIMGVAAFALLLAFAAYAPALYTDTTELLLTWPGLILLMGWSFLIAFHLCTGLRHLIWDTGCALSLPAVRTSNLIVLAGALILTALLWCAILC